MNETLEQALNVLGYDCERVLPHYVFQPATEMDFNSCGNESTMLCAEAEALIGSRAEPRGVRPRHHDEMAVERLSQITAARRWLPYSDEKAVYAVDLHQRQSLT